MHTTAVLGHHGFIGNTLFSSLADEGAAPLGIGRGTPDPSYPLEEVWCCAAPGSMIQANTRPEEDRATVEAIFERLLALAPRRVVLISTIAALERFGAGQDEDQGAPERDTPYGANRALLEGWVRGHWKERALVMRLPALYGPGLKKNALYDLLHPMPSFLRAADARTALSLLGGTWAEMGAWSADDTFWTLDRTRAESHPLAPTWTARLHAAGLSSWRFTHPDSTFQFYDTNRLLKDARALQAQGIMVAHMAPAPLRLGDLAAAYGVAWPDHGARPHHESMQTRHSALFGATPPYIADGEAVQTSVLAFLQAGDQRHG